MADSFPTMQPSAQQRALPMRTAARAVGARNFYIWIALAVTLTVGFGFGRTVNEGLLHPPSPRPLILYVHAVMFTIWVLLFTAQAALVRIRLVRWHRRIGVFGFVLGSFMPTVGIATAVGMARLHLAEGQRNPEQALIVPFFDMLAFAVSFGLAMYWRRKPEYHRRLMLIATCGLTVAAFARFPDWLMPHPFWYVGVDALIVVGAVRDWIVMHRVHPVFLYGVPALALGQAATMTIYLSAAPAWVAISRALLR